jgi:hypothetical protein
MVLVDRSQSTAGDRELYAQACERILSWLQPGDRIVAAYISDRSARDFRAHVDEELPAPLGPMRIWDVPIRYRERRAQWERHTLARRQDVQRKLMGLLSRESTAARTNIFESLRVAGQILASERRRRKLLVLLSDMIEDSEVVNFQRVTLNDAFIQKEIQRQKAKGILPDLQGVTVFVAGAEAEPLERAAAIEKFWREYFAAAGAVIEPGGYSRTLPKFGE